MRVVAMLFVAAVGSAAAGLGFAQGLPPGVAECRAKIEQARVTAAEREASETPRLGDVCPEIAAALDDGVWGEALVGGPSEALLPDEFTALVELAGRYATGPKRQPISTAALDAAVAGVETRTPPPPASLWDRAMQWLQAHLGSNEPSSSGWLQKWLEDVSVPERVVRYLVVALAALLTVATAAIVLNELRAVGAFGGTAVRRVRGGTPGSSTDEARAPVSVGDVRHASADRQPGLLLKLIVRRLKTRARLRDSLTHREIVRASEAALTGVQLDSLRSVANAAERVTYGGWRPSAGDVGPVLDDGEALLGSLGDAPAKRR